MRIHTQNLSAVIGTTRIIEDVNIQINNGEFVGIIGPNGSGKSTLLKCIYRVLKPHGGTVWLDDWELSRLSYKDSAKAMAVVAQHNHYNFDFTVQEVVLMGRAPHKKAMERDNKRDYELVEEALIQVSMEGFQDRIFSTLSGGEQQRIILARALVQETQCLVLDEPTNHLDIKYQLQLMDVVKKLDITVVSAIHDLNIAAMYCDKLYVMKEGKVVAYGKPKEVLTEDLLRAVYEVDACITEVGKDKLINIQYRPLHLI